MSGAFIPVWIIGGPFLGMLFLSLMYRGGTSAASSVDRSFDRDLSDDAALAYAQFREYAPRSEHADHTRSADVGAIAQLSDHVSPGSISEFSGHVSPGAISRLSGPTSPGAISKLSRRVSPGVIARLSGRESPGAISSLSAPKPVGSISSLSRGWFASNLLGLPLLTRSQRPLEPDKTLLTSDR